MGGFYELPIKIVQILWLNYIDIRLQNNHMKLCLPSYIPVRVIKFLIALLRL